MDKALVKLEADNLQNDIESMIGSLMFKKKTDLIAVGNGSDSSKSAQGSSIAKRKQVKKVPSEKLGEVIV